MGRRAGVCLPPWHPWGGWELQTLSGSISARGLLHLAAQFHSQQGQSVPEAEPSSDPEHLALGALGWHRARQSTHIRTRVGSCYAGGGGVALVSSSPLEDAGPLGADSGSGASCLWWFGVGSLDSEDKPWGQIAACDKGPIPLASVSLCLGAKAMWGPGGARTAGLTAVGSEGQTDI